MPKMETDDRELEELVSRVIAGDDEAWNRLWLSLEGRLAAIVAKPRFIGRLSSSEDDQRNIVLEVMTRISDDDFRRLRLYAEKRKSSPGMKFMPWLIVVAKRVAIDYMRSHDEYISHRGTGGKGSQAGEWVQRGEMPAPSRVGNRPPITEQGTALKMMSYAGHELPEDQQEALKMWVQNEGYDRIAEALALDSAKQAEKLVRAALQRLRRHFRTSGSGEQP